MSLELKQKGLSGDQAKAKALIVPGVTLYGYCGGRFGRDSYGDKKVVRIEDSQITVDEEGHRVVSFQIHDWIALVQDSNNAFEEQQRAEKEADDELERDQRRAESPIVVVKVNDGECQS